MLPTPVLVTYILLGASIAMTWLRPVAVGRGRALPLWMPCYGTAFAAALACGVMDWRGGIAIALLAAVTWGYAASKRKAVRYGCALAVVLLALGLGLHAVPGFNNPKIVDREVLGVGTAPFNLYANFDKGSAGLFLLVGFCRRISNTRDLADMARSSLGIALATTVVVLGLGLATGYVGFDAKLPWFAASWIAINLLFTCVMEEALFRGVVQAGISRRTSGTMFNPWLPVLASALLFGLAHAAGGAGSVGFATLAGLGYATAFAATGRIESAILTHFLLNLVHFLGFSYPYLQG